MSEHGFSGDEILSAYLDGEVTDLERSAVEVSLARSAERRAVLAELAVAREAVRSLPEPEVPAGFFVGLEGVVAAIAVAPDARPSERARGRLAWVAGGVAAAALLAALVIPATDRVDPKVRARVDAHGARASVSDDAVSELAPVAAATGGLRR